VIPRSDSASASANMPIKQPKEPDTWQASSGKVKLTQQDIPTGILKEYKQSKHEYEDHADDPLAPEYTASTIRTFPFILHTMLSEVEDIGLSKIVSWRPHGRAFLVHNVEAFVEHVMSLYFKQTQMTSFIRQLNLYGFTRLSARKDRGAYYHPFFLRDRIDLCVKIQRMKVKGGCAPDIPMREPNLYAFPPVGTCKGNDEPGTELEEERANVKVSKVKGSKKLQSHDERTNTPVTQDIESDRISASTFAEFIPRPLPPLFDNSSVASVQLPGSAPSTSVLDIGNDRWVFHISSHRINRPGLPSPSSSQNVTDETESKSADESLSSGNANYAAENMQIASDLASDDQGEPLRSRNTACDDSQRASPFLQLLENMFEKDQVER